jgi:Tfp pilus assembly protein PilW
MPWQYRGTDIRSVFRLSHKALKMRGTLKRQSGRSIIELMIAIAIGLAISSAIVAIYLSSRSTSRTQDSSSQIADSGRFALLLIGRQIRQGGYTTMAYYREKNGSRGAGQNPHFKACSAARAGL